MRRSLGIMLIAGSLCFPLSSQITGKYCIRKIESIKPLIPTTGNVLAAFDWDETISLSPSTETPLREGDATKDTINNIGQNGAHLLILTSRLLGLSLNFPSEIFSSSRIYAELTDMMKGIHGQGILFKNHGALRYNDYEEIRLPSKNSSLVLLEQVVFAGGANRIKGYALQQVMAQGRLKQHPDTIIFVDNEEEVLVEFESSFKEAKENVILFHYPLAEQTCQNGYSVVN